VPNMRKKTPIGCRAGHGSTDIPHAVLAERRGVERFGLLLCEKIPWLKDSSWSLGTNIAVLIHNEYSQHLRYSGTIV
jgi:hypothetical protein